MSNHGDLVLARQGESAADVLTAGHGRVAAVFAQTVYLQGRGGMACLGDASLSSGPLAVAIEGFDGWQDRRLHVGDAWRRKNGGLLLGARTIDCSRARIWRPDAVRAHCQPAALRRALALSAGLVLPDCPSVLARIELGTGQIAGATERAIASRAAPALEGIACWLVDAGRGTAQVQALLPHVGVLIGLGPGLTPAGDDFLTGILIAMHTASWPGTDAFVEAVFAHLQATNAISAAYLRAACEGQASALLHDTVNAHFAQDPSAVRRAVAALGAYGHSSGWDAFAGARFALTGIATGEDPTR